MLNETVWSLFLLIFIQSRRVVGIQYFINFKRLLKSRNNYFYSTYLYQLFFNNMTNILGYCFDNNINAINILWILNANNSDTDKTIIIIIIIIIVLLWWVPPTRFMVTTVTLQIGNVSYIDLQKVTLRDSNIIL